MNMMEQEASAPVVDKKDLRLTRKSGYGTREHVNARDLSRAVAKRIVGSNIKGLEEYSRENLAACIESGSDPRFSVEYKRAGVRVTLYCDLKRCFSSFDRDIVSDAAGNRFWKVTSKFEVNWPAIGSTAAAQTLVFADMLKDLGMLCAELEAEFGSEEVWECGQTAEELAKFEAEKAAKELDAKLKKLIDEDRKHKRVGAKWFVSSLDLPCGTHAVEFSDGKRFSVCIDGSSTATVIRVR